ncbi:PQQ enzyme-like repeat protein [Maribacter vaceletii]|uniref:PQQ enzyme-like repeat protein n=1 Tax=Maribacter vaceletii TaxID=1206816 RepID=A0A495E5C5_9FLAO|nr:PQQ-binding-like beta-propeller repeat protein [Maribacter vaceletii]RKR12144.1 PQQ enzyme-like repeat protein [Maribacter vaceletii]
MKNRILNVLCLFLAFLVKAQDFVTEGNGLRNGVSAIVNGESILYLSELDGCLSAYTTGGKKLWSNKTEIPAVMFEIIAADINGDDNQDVIAASGDGNIYAYDASGELLWKFNPEHKVRFNEVAVVKNRGKIQIFAGGNDYKLYELNANGKLVSETKINGVVRKIESGNFIKKGEQSLFVMTYAHDKFRWEFMGIVNPESKEVIREVSIREKSLKDLTKTMVTDISIADVNKDGKDDILFFGDISWKGFFVGLDGDFNVLVNFKADNKGTQRYAHAQGTSLLPYRDEIVFRVGSILYTCDLQGNLIHKIGKRYKSATYSDLVLDSKNDKLYAIGSLGGGNDVYSFSLKNTNWYTNNPERIGRMDEVSSNIKELYQDALHFKMPSYQKQTDKPWMMITGNKIPKEVKELNGNAIVFIENKGTWSENTSRDDLVKIMGDVALKKDKRKKYNLSRQEIIDRAKQKEIKKEPFVLWAGHGNDPFYTRIETLEEVLKVAPNTCYGFIYAEMDNVEDPRVIHFIKDYMPRLAKALRKNGKAKLYFRYKNMFWALTSHLSPWKEMFFSGEYKDILVPASEDTSSRTQDVNLAGRVGMHSAGYINDFAMRLIDDNPTSWRPYSPGGQRSVSPYLRQGVLMAAYGARIGINFSGLFLEEPGMNVLYALMKSGVLPVVEKDDILSIGSWHLIKDVDEKLVHSVDNHHSLKQYKKDDDNAVFSVAQMHWAGTNVPNHDFSKVALGVDYRWTNYLPVMPNGMVPISSVDYQAQLEKKEIPFTISDGKYEYVNNKQHAAKEFKPFLEEAVKEGGSTLPVLVSGASWSAIKLDATHTRVILIDPGYLDPQERNVTVTFKNKVPTSVVDILSKENLEVINNSVLLKVPAGSLRFIDLAY